MKTFARSIDATNAGYVAVRKLHIEYRGWRVTSAPNSMGSQTPHLRLWNDELDRDHSSPLYDLLDPIRKAIGDECPDSVWLTDEENNIRRVGAISDRYSPRQQAEIAERLRTAVDAHDPR